MLRCFNGQQWRHLNPRYRTPSISSSLHRRNIKRKNTKHSSDQNIEMVIDVKDISNRVSLSTRRFFRSSELRFQGFVSSGRETFRDLQSLIKIDADGRVVISCRRSSLQFMAILVLWSCIIASVVAILVRLGMRFRSGLGFGYGVLVRRDRSLAGREVVVASRSKEREGKKKGSSVSFSPLSPARGTVKTVAEVVTQRRSPVQEKKLPSWWPVLTPSPILTVNKLEYQEEANRLIRAIMDNRMSGMDIKEDDIIQLRRISRTSGVRVSVETANERDYLYRASVDLVLNICSSWMSHSTTVQIDGEDARQFIAGLADNIGLESIHAVRIVSGAVAARTRSRFLQAWALEMQGKHSDAVTELSKICLIHHTFPPEEFSPEMEMVAIGLEKHLRVEQREFLMKMLVEVCGARCTRSAAEALGLMHTKYAGEQQETPYL